MSVSWESMRRAIGQLFSILGGLIIIVVVTVAMRALHLVRDALSAEKIAAGLALNTVANKIRLATENTLGKCGGGDGCIAVHLCPPITSFDSRICPSLVINPAPESRLK